MSKRNMLFITEGPVDEPEFIKKLLKTCISNVEYNIYPYHTSIHDLTSLLFNNKNEIDDDLEITKVLKEQESDIKQRQILEKNYTDIVLAFDFEPHYHAPEFEKVGKMLEYFNDSSNMGKLYINYPMMQSYKHLTSFPDINFKDRKIYKMDASHYKAIVEENSKYKHLGKYNFPIIMQLIGHHLMKANFILHKQYKLMDYSQFIKLDYKEIYNIQKELNDLEEWIYVLNTFVFFVIEFNPTNILQKINNLM